MTTEPVCKFAEGCHRVKECDPGCGAYAPPDLRGGFWPNMTGGRCAHCHLADIRGEEVDPDHPVCVAIDDGMRISTVPARPDEVLLHLPAFTYWDTQAYSAEVGIPAEHLPALKAVVDAWLAQRAVDASKES